MPPYTAADILYPRLEVFDAWLHRWFAAIEHGEIVRPTSDDTPDTITVPHPVQAAGARPALSLPLHSCAHR